MPDGHVQTTADVQPKSLASSRRQHIPVFSVGERVAFTPSKGSPGMATIRCIFLDDNANCILGIEFDQNGFGKHDGMDVKSGKRHFTCPPGRGLFIRSDSSRLRPVEATTESDIAARRKLSLGLEAMEERETLRLAKIGQRAEEALKADADEEGAGHGFDSYRKKWDSQNGRYNYFNRSEVLGTKARSLPKGGNVATVEGGPEAAHPDMLEGAVAVLPTAAQGFVSPEEAHFIFDHCATNWTQPLRSSVLLDLARGARDLFLKEHTCHRISTPPGGKLVVFGDTHGHLKDLVHVWRREGLPGPGCVYIFNGDICDRGDAQWRGGQQSLHIWACVLSFKLAYPDCVFVNRGNHESGSYWSHSGSKGFAGEIFTKYPRAEADQLVDAFADLCESLPLCTVVDERCLVVHGGLPRFWMGAGAVTLDEIDRIKRPIRAHSGSSDRSEQILTDLTWADPQRQNGVGTNRRGDSIISFGPNITQAFLENNNVGLVIRSHQVPGTQPEYEGRGFEWWHSPQAAVSKVTLLNPAQEGFLLTLFTASDYCGHNNSNCGGTVVFNGSVSQYRIIEHTGAEAEATLLGHALAGNPLHESHSLSHAELLRDLIEVIVKRKHQLLEEFLAQDSRRDWYLSTDDFVACCYRVVYHVPWELYVKEASIVPLHQGRVCYTEFLTRYQLSFRNQLGRHSGFRRALGSQLFEAIVRADRTLRETLGVLDPDRDGLVSVEEFADALSMFGNVLPKAQAKALYRTTIASEGNVRVEDFLGSLSLHFTLTHARPTTAEDAFVPSLLDGLCRDILADEVARGGSASVAVLLRRFFERTDTNGSGYIEPSELASALKALPSALNLSDAQLQAVARYMDFSGNGTINYPELLSALCVSHTEDVKGGTVSASEAAAGRPGPAALLEDVLEAVYRVLHFDYALPMLGLLRQLVQPGSTRCSLSIFEKALVTLNRGEGGAKLSRQQIKCLLVSLDLDYSHSEEGEFDFEDFFCSFGISDTLADHSEHGPGH